MTEDHLDNEISVKASLTPSGIEAKSKMRTLSAIDRLVGAFVDQFVAPLEGKAAEARAISAGRIKLIDAATEAGVRMVGEDPDLAERAIETHLRTTVRQQINKENVVRAAIEDLSREPPSKEQNSQGPETLSDEFLDRFDDYAKDANSDELRERWGRILASEIRQPGTFSKKVLRVVDELDAGVAALFEKFCQNRIKSVVPLCLSGKLAFGEFNPLVTSGLIVDPGATGQIISFGTTTTSTGIDIHIVQFQSRMLGITKNSSIPADNQTETQYIYMTDHGCSMKVYVLTNEGEAIASIINDNSADTLNRLRLLIQAQLEYCELFEFDARGVQISHHVTTKPATSSQDAPS